MADPTPQRDRSSLDDRPVMGDHPDLEADETFQALPIEDGGNRSRLIVAGIVVLVIVVLVVAYVVFS
jgi:hypothetical protein